MIPLVQQCIEYTSVNSIFKLRAKQLILAVVNLLQLLSAPSIVITHLSVSTCIKVRIFVHVLPVFEGILHAIGSNYGKGIRTACLMIQMIPMAKFLFLGTL